MKITDALLGEHGAFYAQFTMLEESADTATLSALQAASALLAASLIPHAQIEDEILFPALEAEIGPDGLTHVMRTEHTDIEALLQRIETVRELLHAHDDIEGAFARLPAETDPAQARTMMHELLEMTRDHFSKEENMLFPMAEQMLSARVLCELGDQWAERRGVRLSQ